MLQLPATALNTASATAIDQLPETWAGRRIREIRQAALSILSRALTSPLISKQQRQRAEAKAATCHDLQQLLSWHSAVNKYVAAVQAGEREPRAEQAEEIIEQAAPAVVPAVMPARQAQPKKTYRPARRMPVEKLARLRASNQARRDALEQLRTPTPMWAETTRLTALPGGLYWSGQGQVPEVGKAVMVSRPGGLSGKATVKGYFHAEGFLGLVTDFEKVPSKFKGAPRNGFVFGRDLQQAA